MANMATSPGMPENDYQAEDDLRTMKRAAEIHKNRKRLKLMHKFAKKEIDGIQRVSKYAKLAAGNDKDADD